MNNSLIASIAISFIYLIYSAYLIFILKKRDKLIDELNDINNLLINQNLKLSEKINIILLNEAIKNENYKEANLLRIKLEKLRKLIK